MNFGIWLTYSTRGGAMMANLCLDGRVVGSGVGIEGLEIFDGFDWGSCGPFPHEASS